jgi:hypothetical protein
VIVAPRLMIFAVAPCALRKTKRWTASPSVVRPNACSSTSGRVDERSAANAVKMTEHAVQPMAATHTLRRE